MNKNAIQKFAVWARVQLIGAVKQRAFAYEITGGGDKPELDAAGGRLLTNAEKSQRRELIGEIRRKGFDQVMEEAAYTWFNRFIALRFMEVNNYLPSKVRLFTDENGAFKPQILKEAMTVELDGLDRSLVLELLDKQENEALYKYLLITQCNALNAALPGMFEKIANWTELLFPDNLLRSDNVLGRMISDIPEEDWQDAVQIIGWLYQYYNTELKDDTFAQLKKNIKITKERIPAATQLFTPDWIVRYMVENSLGRLWIDHLRAQNEGMHPVDSPIHDPTNPNSYLYADKKIKHLRDRWKYYLDEPEQEDEVEWNLRLNRQSYLDLNPEDIKIIDPCMGSGHILVYAFDVLMQIYEAQGYSQRDAAKLIVEKNLYGIDIDKRAYQLAYFSAMMKARQYNRRILNGEIAPNLIYIQDSNSVCREHLQYFGWAMSKIESNNARTQLEYLLDTFKDATEYGSILHVDPLDWGLLYEYTGSVEYPDQVSLDELDVEETKDALRALVVQGAILAQKYDVVVTNPPYMGSSGMSAKLSEYVKKHYPDSKADMFAVFIERCGQMAKKNGYQAMITQHAWMFLSSFEKLRTKLLTVDIVNMAHLGARAFEEIGGEVVQTTSFVIRKSHIADYRGEYCRLIEPTSQQGKEELFLSGKLRFYKKQDVFSYIPGRIFGYWLSERLIQILIGEKPLSEYGETRKGLSTSDNSRFIRLWHEIDFNRVKFGCSGPEDTFDDKFKWYPYIHGGVFQKWYPPFDSVVNFEDDAKEIKDTVMKKYPYLSSPDFVVKKTEIYFKPGIVWNDLADVFNAKNMAPGYIYSDVTPSYIPQEHWNSVLAYFNSNVFAVIAKVVSQGMHYSTGHIPKIPYIQVTDTIDTYISPIVQECIDIVETDETSFESSWDFTRNPLV